MRPQWFALPKELPQKLHVDAVYPPVPFEKMWADDLLWFPMLLGGESFCGRVDFTECQDNGTGGKMTKFWFGVADA